MRSLIEALPSPVWARDEAGKLIYVNAAYARAVEARDGAEAAQRGIELFDRNARADLNRAHESEQPFSGRLPRDRRRRPPQLRRAHLPGPARLDRHRHRCHRSRGHARRAQARDRRASPHARSSDHRRRDLRLRPEACVLQRRLSLALGPRRDLPRPRTEQFRRARPPARRAAAAGAAGLPQMEGRAARGLSRDRGHHPRMAPAGRPHAARRHHAQSGRRRDLSVRRHHRAARAAPPLRGADPGAGRDARQPHRGGRGVRERRPACVCSIRCSRRCGSSIRPRCRTARTSRR